MTNIDYYRITGGMDASKKELERQCMGLSCKECVIYCKYGAINKSQCHGLWLMMEYGTPIVNRVDTTVSDKDLFNRMKKIMETRSYMGHLDHQSTLGIHDVKNCMKLTPAVTLNVRVGSDCWITKQYNTDDGCIYRNPSDMSGVNSHIGPNCYVSEGIRIKEGVDFGSGCVFAGNNVFEGYSHFGDYCMFGPGCMFPMGSTFGEGCKFIGSSKPEPVRLIKEFTVSKIDGSGRDIIIKIYSDYSCNIKAGCYTGTLDEFCQRSDQEHKPFYSNCIRDIVVSAIRVLKAKHKHDSQGS